jgi:outer membrane protein OmpA-like peptidoglycan-associated protein
MSLENAIEKLAAALDRIGAALEAGVPAAAAAGEPAKGKRTSKKDDAPAAAPAPTPAPAPNPTPVAEEPAAAPAAAAPVAEEPAPTGRTFADFTAFATAVRAVKDTSGLEVEAIQQVLQKFGAGKMSELKPTDWGKFYAAVDAL